jgi:hypothetical protein
MVMMDFDRERIIKIGAAIGIIFLLLFGFYQLFRGLGSLITRDEPPVASIDLVQYTNNTSNVQFTYDGVINGQDEHRSIRISVSGRNRRIQIIKGYNNSVIFEDSFANTPEAYAVFLRALKYEGFMDRQDSSWGDDERGACPEGNRMIMQLNNQSSSIERLWWASCNRKLGTLAGDAADIQDLFESQIPDYRGLTRDVKLR